MLSRRWYLLCLVPIAICAPIALFLLKGLMDDVAAMPRFAVPGASTMKLAAGDYTAFAETRTILGGEAVRNDGTWSATCTLADSQGRPVTLDSVGSTHTKYALGDYAGSSLWTFTIPGADTYAWTCTSASGDARTGVLAVGQGVGGAVVKAVLVILAGVFSAVAPFLLVFLRRRRAKQMLAARGAAT